MFPVVHWGQTSSTRRVLRVTEITAECCIRNGFSIKTGLINGVRCCVMYCVKCRSTDQMVSKTQVKSKREQNLKIHVCVYIYIYIYIYMTLTHFAVQLKLTQNCKSIILQQRILRRYTYDENQEHRRSQTRWKWPESIPVTGCLDVFYMLGLSLLMQLHMEGMGFERRVTVRKAWYRLLSLWRIFLVFQLPLESL